MILDGSSGERGIHCSDNWMHVGAPSANVRIGYGNFEFYNTNGKVHFVDGDGSGWFRGHVSSDSWGWFGGDLTVKGKLWADGGIQAKGIIEFNTGLEIKTGTPYIDFRYQNSDNDYTTRIIQDSESMLSIYGGGLTIERDLWVRGGKINGYGIGEAIQASVFDKQSLVITDIPYGKWNVASAGSLRICMDNLSWAWGKHTFDSGNAWSFGGASNEIPTTQTLAAVRNDLNNQIQNRIIDMRFVKVLESGWAATTKYGANDGEVIGWVQADNAINNYGDYICVYRLQFYKNGAWHTVPRV